MRRPRDLARVAHAGGRNITRQRRAILEALRNAEGHPTALELYDAARQELPGLTQATVYRNLQVLQELGLIAEVEGVDGARRFDDNPERHRHVVCTRCGRVADIMVRERAATLDQAQQATDFQLTGYRLSFEGICPQCRRNEEAPNDQRRD